MDELGRDGEVGNRRMREEDAQSGTFYLTCIDSDVSKHVLLKRVLDQVFVVIALHFLKIFSISLLPW